MPASAIARLGPLPPQVLGLSGRALDGSARLVGGYVLDWRAGLPRGLFLPVKFTLVGDDTRITGEAQLVIGGGEVRQVQGRAGPGLLALAGETGLVCDASASLDVDRLAWVGSATSADGRIDVREGRCSRAGQVADVPAMAIDLGTGDEGAEARVERVSDGTDLGTVGVIGDRTLRLRVEKAGVALIPGFPFAGPLDLRIPF